MPSSAARRSSALDLRPVIMATVDAVSLQQLDTQTVFDVERLYLRRFAIAVEQRAVGHDAVDVEYNKLNVLCFLSGAAVHEMPAFSKASRVKTPSTWHAHPQRSTRLYDAVPSGPLLQRQACLAIPYVRFQSLPSPPCFLEDQLYFPRHVLNHCL